MQRSMVLFPEPLGPQTTTVWPRWITSLMRLRTWKWPYHLDTLSIEIMAMAHPFDALVMIPNCDKIIPGMLMAALDLANSHPDATREQIRAHLSGNYCRCTGYQAIVDAVEAVLAAKRQGGRR